MVSSSSSSYKPRKMSNKTQPVLYGPSKRRCDAFALGALCAWLRSHGVECDKTMTYATSERFGALGTAKRDMDEGEAAFSLPLRSKAFIYSKMTQRLADSIMFNPIKILLHV